MSDSRTRAVGCPPDQRAAARFETTLPADVGGARACTRNISASGVYLETEREVAAGALVDVSVQFTHGGRKQWLSCEGKVVRVTREGGCTGVAARWLTPFFSPVEERHVARAARR